MKFGRNFEKSKIPEWADFYVSYKLLKKLLSPFKAMKKGSNFHRKSSNIFLSAFFRSNLNSDAISIHNFTAEDIIRLDKYAKAFESTIFEDLEKVKRTFFLSILC